ncbi:MAG: SDR family NAD(P)-dependent oxidoreductase [Mycobacterium sp.]|nr:SDR family NAD(P)-dependent oxidoreductase [Mycobacterium sp.]
MSWSTKNIPDLHGKVAVVTGANGGLGLASAKALAGKGAHVVMAARNQAKAADAHAEILAAHPDASLEIVELDLGSLASVAAAAKQIGAKHRRIDILMCNAGVMAMPQGSTEDGFDTQMGINVLGHWALISHLLPIIVATPGARVVTLSSTAQHTGRAIDPADPHMRNNFDEWRMYGQTKLTKSMGMSTDRGALSQLRAAVDPKAPGGGFYGPLFVTNGPPVGKPLIRPGSDSAIASLWQVAERETGLRVDVKAALGD